MPQISAWMVRVVVAPKGVMTSTKTSLERNVVFEAFSVTCSTKQVGTLHIETKKTKHSNVTHIHICIHIAHTATGTTTSADTPAYTNADTNTETSTCTHAHAPTHAYTCARTPSCAYACMYTTCIRHECVWIYMFYIHTYIHTYILSLSLSTLQKFELRRAQNEGQAFSPAVRCSASPSAQGFNPRHACPKAGFTVALP